MKTLRALLLLSLLSALAVAGSGCSTHTNNGKKETVVLGGLYESREGAYEKQSLNSFPVNQERPGPASRLTGNKVTILWGLISYSDQ
jgi:hypothetical protein